MNTDVAATKQALRSTALAARNALTPVEIASRSARIHERLEALPVYRDASTVLTYVAFQSEVATLPLIRRRLADHQAVRVPYIEDRIMAWSPIATEDDLAPGLYGILEPHPTKRQPVDVPEHAVVLVPCLQFSLSGHRLGYGGGYFDRFLKTFQGTSIALAFDLQQIDTLPIEAHDIPVNHIVTESQIFNPG